MFAFPSEVWSPRCQVALPAVILAALTAVPIAPAAADKPVFTPLDVFALEWASDPEISPDGARVAYVRRSFDVKSDSRRGAIWLVDRDGGNHRPLVDTARATRAARAGPRTATGSPSSPRTAMAHRYTCTGSGMA